MIILSLDLSLNCSGWAVIDTSKRQKKQRLIDYGIIYNKHLTSEQIGLKLYHIELELKSLLYAFNPDVIVVEELLVNGRYNQSAMITQAKLAMVHGILNKLTMKFKNVHTINNKTLKKEFAGKGDAGKEEVMAKVLEYFPDACIRTDDMSDAIALGILYTIQNDICTW